MSAPPTPTVDAHVPDEAPTTVRAPEPVPTPEPTPMPAPAPAVPTPGKAQKRATAPKSRRVPEAPPRVDPATLDPAEVVEDWDAVVSRGAALRAPGPRLLRPAARQAGAWVQTTRGQKVALDARRSAPTLLAVGDSSPGGQVPRPPARATAKSTVGHGGGGVTSPTSPAADGAAKEAAPTRQKVARALDLDRLPGRETVARADPEPPTAPEGGEVAAAAGGEMAVAAAPPPPATAPPPAPASPDGGGAWPAGQAQMPQGYYSPQVMMGHGGMPMVAPMGMVGGYAAPYGPMVGAGGVIYVDHEGRQVFPTEHVVVGPDGLPMRVPSHMAAGYPLGGAYYGQQAAGAASPPQSPDGGLPRRRRRGGGPVAPSQEGRKGARRSSRRGRGGGVSA